MTNEELKCIADELLQTAYECTTYGNYIFDKEEVIARAKNSLGLNIDNEEIETVFSLIEDETEFLLDGEVSYDGDELDIMMGYKRCLDGILFVAGEEDEAKEYHKFVKGYENFEKQFPMEWDYFSKELILPISKDGRKVTALTELQAKKIYQDVVVEDILNDEGEIKPEYLEELIENKQERIQWAHDLIAKYNTPDNAYLFLGRVMSDNDYYINSGRHEKHLWAGDVVKQTELMKALYLSFNDEKKPEWLSLHDVAEYQKNMSQVKFENDMSETVDKLLQLYKDTFPYDWQDYALYNDAFAENVKNDIREEIIHADEKGIEEFLYDRLLEPFEECDDETKKEALQIKNSFEGLYMDKKNYRIVLDDELNKDEEIISEMEIEDMVEELEL